MSILSAEYKLRFSKVAQYRQRVWKVLCGTFFQTFIQPSSRVLDLGCGWGEFINNIDASHKHAMDLNPESSEKVNASVLMHTQDCSDKWPLQSGSLDVVFTSNFLEHLESKEHISRTLDEAYRCLDESGYVICMGPNIKYTEGAYWDFWDHVIPLTENSLTEILRMKGFKIVKCYSKFLPYTMANEKNPPLLFVWIYLRIPFLWSLFGKQFLVIAMKSSQQKAQGESKEITK